MSLRLKLALAFALLAAVVAFAANSLSYHSSRSELYKQIDSSLISSSQSAANTVQERSGINQIDPGVSPESGPKREEQTILPPPGRGALGNQVFVTQYLAIGGAILLAGDPALPVNKADLAIAREGRRGPTKLSSIIIGREHLRMATTPLAGGGAIQIARSVEDSNTALEALRSQAITLTIIIILIAGLVGFALARSVVRPLEVLTEAAERVATSGQPDADITVKGKDEIGRLGRVLSRMLVSLNQSQRQQERLVQDAGHELRTPLTSITTNVALLNRFDDLSEEQRRLVIDDLKSESEEMSHLVNELVALTTIGADETATTLNLKSLATEVSAKAERRWRRPINVFGENVSISGRPRALKHAILNLVDNAVKFSPDGGTVSVTVAADYILVTDQGPGITEGEEDLIFERFYRSIDSRSTDGSGLGLAIVDKVARQHGGAGFAHPGPGGKVGFSFQDNSDPAVA